MKRSRSSLVLVTVLALVGSACSRFAPKADVSINTVGIELAFGVDVEELLKPPPVIPTTPPLIFELPPEQPLPPLPPAPPPTPFCLPNQTQSPRDGQAPPSVKPGNFDVKHPEAGGNFPRRGSYPTFYQGNYAGEESFNRFSNKKIGVFRETKDLSLFYYKVTDEGHGVSMEFSIVYEASQNEDGDTSNSNLTGIYLRSITLPLKEDPLLNRVYIPANAETGGLKLATFPLGGGQVTEDTQPNRAANEQEVNGETLPLSPPSATLSSKVIIAGKPQNVLVCDQLAQAWRFNTSIEITGDVDVSIIGSFWFATQYGGWPIQEAFTMDGGDTFISGNFLGRLARLDPGEEL